MNRDISTPTEHNIQAALFPRKMKPLLVCALLPFLFGCATPYQETSWGGGFSETQLDENVWIVTFKGNAYTSKEKAIEFNLLRCADLCLENGYKYFVIVEEKEYSKEDTITLPATTYTTGSVQAYGNNAYGTATSQTYGGQTLSMSKPRTSNTIVCFKEKPSVDGLIYNAEFLRKSIREKRGLSTSENAS